jgi:hypothetical protein
MIIIKTWFSSVALKATSNNCDNSLIFERCELIMLVLYHHLFGGLLVLSVFLIPECNTKPSSATQINVSNVTAFPYEASTWYSQVESSS